MSELTRRKFLGRASLAAAAAGGLAGGVVAGLAPRLEGLGGPQGQAAMAPIGLSDPVVAHVRDLASGEVAVMIGTKEVVYRDPELVARLVARRAALGQG